MNRLRSYVGLEDRLRLQRLRSSYAVTAADDLALWAEIDRRCAFVPLLLSRVADDSIIERLAKRHEHLLQQDDKAFVRQLHTYFATVDEDERAVATLRNLRRESDEAGQDYNDEHDALVAVAVDIRQRPPVMRRRSTTPISRLLTRGVATTPSGRSTVWVGSIGPHVRLSGSGYSPMP